MVAQTIVTSIATPIVRAISNAPSVLPSGPSKDEIKAALPEGMRTTVSAPTNARIETISTPVAHGAAAKTQPDASTSREPVPTNNTAAPDIARHDDAPILATAPVAHASAHVNTPDQASPAPATNASAPAVQPVTAAAPVQTQAVQSPATADAPLRLPEHASPHDAGAAPEIQALAVRIAAKSAQGNRRFDIRLDPPELGRIDVRLDVDDAGRANAQLSADKPQTLELLSRDHRHLERALKDAGLDLGGMSFSLKGEERQSQNAPHAARALAETEARTQTPTAALAAQAARWSTVTDARVDIRI